MRRFLNSRRSVLVGPLFATLLLVLPLACARGEQETASRAPAGAETETAARQRAAQTSDLEAVDAEVAHRVYLRLLRSRSLGGSRLDVETENARVTLDGRVAHERARERAERIAARTFGVEGVDNRLEVDAALTVPDVPDGELAESIVDALSAELLDPREVRDTWLSGWKLLGDDWTVEIDVDNGTVVLAGEVPRRDDVAEIARVVHRVPGVRAVLSDLGWQSGDREAGTPYPSGYYPYGYPTGHPRGDYPYDWDWYDPNGGSPAPSVDGS